MRKLRLTRALTLSEDTAVSEACRRMAAKRVDAALLTDANGMLSGILTAEVRAQNRAVGKGGGISSLGGKGAEMGGERCIAQDWAELFCRLSLFLTLSIETLYAFYKSLETFLKN